MQNNDYDHSGMFLLPLMYRYPLSETTLSMMLIFQLLAIQKLHHELHDVLLYSTPPIMLLQIHDTS